MTTRDRVLAAALASFGGTGYEASSLDQLAVELGIRKQTILYYYPSKAELLDAVIDASSAELAATLEDALADAGTGWARVEAIICSVCCARSVGSGRPRPPASPRTSSRS